MTTTAEAIKSPQSLLGICLNSSDLISYIDRLCNAANKSGWTPEVKSYPDAVYLNYYSLGTSFLFSPKKGYKPEAGLKLADLDNERLVLEGIDIYNTSKSTRPTTRKKPTELAFTSHPISVLTIEFSEMDSQRSSELKVQQDTTGKKFVASLGEPERKGGGLGPSSGSIGIWCEWSKLGIMVEFGGDEANGPQAWELGKDAMWKVLTFFPPVQNVIPGKFECD